MYPHPVAARIGAAVAGRDPHSLATELTESVRLRALVPTGPIHADGRDDVAARLHGLLAGFDGVALVESAGEAVADRLLIHYRLHLTQGTTSWVCTQTAVCKLVDGLVAVVDLLCSGFREVSDEHAAA